MSSAGDVNGDGFDDLLISSYAASSGAYDAVGATFVVFGKRGGFSGTLDLAALNGTNGFRISGAAEYDYSGFAVSSAGDMNGDGFDDLIIGAPSVNLSGVEYTGAAYIVFGKTSFPATLGLSSLTGQNGFRITGEAGYDAAGSAVSGAGDVNGDGFDDVLIGAPGASVSSVAYNGAAFVVFGKAQAFPATLSLLNLTGANGFRISGAAPEDTLGSAVSRAGDVNGDGFDDVLIGAYGADPHGSLSGASYVVFGKAGGFSRTISVAALNGANGFALRGAAAYDQFGESLSSAGDVNGDGFADILVGAYGASENGPGSGASYVVFGKSSGFSAALDVSTLNGLAGFKILGEKTDDNAGGSVSGVGDVDGDGFDDLLIGAEGADANGHVDSGATYVIFGKAGGFGSTLQLSALNGVNGFKMNGEAAANNAGQAVSGAGDLNADGFADLLIGAPSLSSSGREGAGGGYVVFGQASGPVLSVSDGVAQEGNSGTTPVTFAVSLNAPTTKAVTVKVASANGTAIGGTDFDALPLTNLTFAPGETTKTVTVNVRGDVAIEPHETFSVVLSAATNAQIADAQGLGTIRNDDTAIRIADANRNEGNSGMGPMTFAVTLDQPSVLPVSVGFQTANGTAIGGSDFQAANGTVLFAPGETSKTISIQVIGDATAELDETFTVPLSTPTNAAIADGTATGTIRNDDAAPGLRISDGAARETNSGTAGLAFTVTLDAPAAQPVSVTVATGNGTAISGTDFDALPATVLTFAPGQTSKTVTVALRGDTVIEPNESFSVLLSAATGAPIADGQGIGTVLNDDTAARIADASVTEGSSGVRPLNFLVSLEQPSVLPVSVAFQTADGSATAASDYTAAAGTVQFAPGETTKTISVQAKGDVLAEPDETLSVVLSNATNAAIADGNATGLIRNDDAAPGLRVTDASARENNSGTTGLSFTVSLDAPSAQVVTVNVASANGTALAGTDFNALPPTVLTFAPGETSKTITVAIRGDTTIEPHETFSVILSSATNAPINDAQGIGTILNDDTALRIGDATASEGGNGVTPVSFTVTLEQPTVLPVSVGFQTTSGTATSGSDFNAAVGTLQFGPGEISKTITVQAKGDTTAEADETFTVALANATNASIADATGTGLIRNDDSAQFNVSNGSVLEGHSGSRNLVFNVTLSSPQSGTATVNFATSGGTATAGADYTAASGKLTFLAGQVSQSVSVAVQGDLLAEQGETFDLVLSVPVNATIGDGSGVGTILNDDVQILGLRKARFTDVDGDIAKIRVSSGRISAADFVLVPSGAGSQLAFVDFNGATALAGTALQIKAKPGGPGDGVVNVGYIDARGIDLSSVSVTGDLGRIDVGDAVRGGASLGMLQAGSFGKLGLTTQLPGGSLQSNVTGTLGILELADGMTDARLAATKNIGAVTIGGDLVRSFLHADRRIGAVTIDGDLMGSAQVNASITALGIKSPADSALALAIAQVTVRGEVKDAQILAGYDRQGVGANADARIGFVKVIGDWVASDLVAGARAGADGFFGNGDDVRIPGGNSTIASIDRIVVKGNVLGTPAGGDHFGFVAEELVSVKIGSTVLPLAGGARNDLSGLALAATNDVRAREVSA